MPDLSSNIFVTWSGEKSLKIAEALVKQLQLVVTGTRASFSPDIEKGTNWESVLNSQLSSISAGIVCLTPENLEAPWIHWEAGRLFKTLESTRLYTYLYDVSPNEVKRPLGSWQHTLASSKKDTLQMVKDIAMFLGSTDSEHILTERMDELWPKFENKLKAIRNMKDSKPRSLSMQDMIVSVLDYSREDSKHLSALSTVLNRIETSLATTLGKVEIEVGKLIPPDKIARPSEDGESTSKTAPQADEVASFWRRIGFDCGDPSKQELPSPIHVTF